MALEITIDRELCMGSGNCSFWAPGVFDLDDEGIAVVLDADRAAGGDGRARRAGLPDAGDPGRRGRHDARLSGRPDAHVRRVPACEHADRTHRRARSAPPRGPPLRRHAHPTCRDARGARRRTRSVPDVLVRALRTGLARPARRRGERRRRLRLRRAGRGARGARVGPRRPVRTSRPCSRPPCSKRRAGPRPRSCSRSSASGELTGAVALGPRRADPRWRARRRHRASSDATGAWYALDASTLSVRACKSVDPTRRVARVDLGGAELPGGSPPRRSTVERVVELAAVLLAAEAVGVAQWCVDTAAEYAKVRVQFGRPIGQFQGVKHRCADMLARTELARAAVWDAARAVRETDNGARVAIAAAAALAFDAAFLERQGLRADARRHRLHVGARRARLPAARDDAARSSPARPTRGASTPRRAAMAGGRRSLGDRSPGGGRGDARRAPRVPRRDQGPRRRPSSAPGWSTRVTSRRRGRSRGAATPPRSSCS